MVDRGKPVIGDCHEFRRHPARNQHVGMVVLDQLAIGRLQRLVIHARLHVENEIGVTILGMQVPRLDAGIVPPLDGKYGCHLIEEFLLLLMHQPVRLGDVKKPVHDIFQDLLFAGKQSAHLPCIAVKACHILFGEIVEPRDIAGFLVWNGKDISKSLHLIRCNNTVRLGHLGRQPDHGNGKSHLAACFAVALEDRAQAFDHSRKSACCRSGNDFTESPENRHDGNLFECAGRQKLLPCPTLGPNPILPPTIPVAAAMYRVYSAAMTDHNNLARPLPNMPLAYLLGFAGVAIFGITLPVTRLALADFSPWFITFARALLGAAAALSFLLMTGRNLRHSENGRIFLAGLFLIFGFPAFMALAMQTVPASHGGVVLGFLPIATAAIAALIAGERHSPRFWLLCITGAVIVTAYSLWKGDGTSTGASLGDLWLLFAGLCASSGYVISGKLARSMPGWEVICRALVLNLPLIAAGTWFSFEPTFLSASPSGLIAMFYLGLGSMFLGFFAWNSALAMGGIARIGQVQLLQTFVTLAASALILGEHIDALTLITAILVTALIFLTKRS